MKTIHRGARLATLAAGLAVSGCFSPNGATSGAAGSGGGSGAPDAGATAPLPCDVAQVLADRCNSCHARAPLFGAPMPLVSFADLHAPSRSSASVPVYQMVETRTHDDARPMPPAPNARLNAAEQATLDAWVATGAPAGNGARCSGGGSPPASDAGTGSGSGGDASSDASTPPSDCVFDTHIAPSTPFAMTGQEEYACYGFDIPTAGKRHVTEIKVRLDNTSIVHHILLLESPTSVSGTPAPCSPAPSFAAPMMYAWAPGGNPLVLPAEAGFAQDQTTHYLVQVHYNNAANVQSPVDATGFDLCTTANLRKYDADVIAFGSEQISIPPLASATVTNCYTVPSSLDGRSFFGAFPHMHQLGTTIATTLRGGDGAQVDLGQIAHWQFSNQPWLPISAFVSTGDVIRTTCSWNNTTALPVSFGQSTTDEMCYSFSAYYPKADVSLGWAVPATLSVPCQ